MNSSISRAALAATVLMAALAASITSASAHRWGGYKISRHDRTIVHVSNDEDYGWRRNHRRNHRYDGPVVVDAPFTYVETGYRRRVAVDAPFTSVRVHRGGVWVRAPFVNLWVPR